MTSRVVAWRGWCAVRSSQAGRHAVLWRGEDDRGRRLASGVYSYRLRANGEVRVGRITLVK